MSQSPKPMDLDDGDEDLASQLKPQVDLLKSVWEGKRGNWCHIDKDAEKRLSEIISTYDFRSNPVQILRCLCQNKNDLISITSCVQVTAYAIIYDLKSTETKPLDLEIWIRLPNKLRTILDFIFPLVPRIIPHLLTVNGPKFHAERSFILYETLVCAFAALIMRSDPKHFPRFESTLINYILSDKPSQAILALDIWVILLRANPNIREPQILHLAHKLSSLPYDKINSVSSFIARAYKLLDGDVKDSLKSELMPLKRLCPWLYVEMTPQQRLHELTELISMFNTGSHVNLIDVRSACHLLTLCDGMNIDSPEVRKIVPFVYDLKKNYIQRGTHQRQSQKIINSCFLLVTKFMSLKSLDDLLSYYIEQQEKDAFSLATDDLFVADPVEQIFIATVFHSDCHRIVKSSFTEPIIDKIVYLKCYSPVAESIWLEFWTFFCRAVPYVNLVRKHFSFSSRVSQLDFNRRQNFYDYLLEKPSLEDNVIFSHLKEFFEKSTPNGCQPTTDLFNESSFIESADVEEPPVKKKKLLAIGSNGKLIPEPFEDLLNESLMRLKASVQFLAKAPNLPDSCKSSLDYAAKTLSEIRHKHWPKRKGDKAPGKRAVVTVSDENTIE